MDKIIIFIFDRLNITKEYVSIINLYSSREEYTFIICDAKEVGCETQKIREKNNYISYVW